MPDETPDPAQHDLGGNPRLRCVPVEPESDPPMSDFDRRVDAVRAVLREKGHLTTDEQRLHIEGLPERDYFGLTYYEKWLRSVSAIALAKGLVTWDEIS